MAANSRARVERHEPEWFRRRSVNDLAALDAQMAAHDRELIGERDIHISEDVLNQFGDSGARDGDDADAELLIEQRSHLRALLGDSADDLGDVDDFEMVIARVDPLRRKGRHRRHGDDRGQGCEERPQVL